MVGIGPVGGGLSPYAVTPPRDHVVSGGSDPSGVLGTRAGLGASNSVVPGTRRPAESNPIQSEGSPSAQQDLTDEEQQQVEELKQRDREVRRHEQAHVAAAGRYANGGPNFSFTTGPDGRQYATGGHVNIDVGPANTPEATLQKAQVIRRAALAPGEPSAQDRAVAAAASQLEIEARREIQEARQEAANGGDDGTASGAAPTSDVPGTGATAEPDALSPPPALPRREFSEYVPEPGGGRGGGGVRRLDLLV